MSKKCLALAVVLISTGCGMNIGDPAAGKTTLADARAACADYFVGSRFDAVLNLYQLGRDEGITEVESFSQLSSICSGQCEPFPSGWCNPECLTCNTQIITAV